MDLYIAYYAAAQKSLICNAAMQHMHNCFHHRVTELW
jgi:hypothetical protein